MAGDAAANGDKITLATPLAAGAVPDVAYVYDSTLTKRVLFVVEGGSLSADRRTFAVKKKNYQPVDKPDRADAFLNADLTDYYFPAGSTIKVKVLSPGAYGVGGISPGLAGKTIVFTGWVAAAQSLDTLVHEMTHAFGLAHKCGNWDHKGTSSSCPMNYNSWFVLDDATPRKPIRWTNGKVRTSLCAPHLRVVREAHLEDLPSLGW